MRMALYVAIAAVALVMAYSFVATAHLVTLNPLAATIVIAGILLYLASRR